MEDNRKSCVNVLLWDRVDRAKGQSLLMKSKHGSGYMVLFKLSSKGGISSRQTSSVVAARSAQVNVWLWPTWVRLEGQYSGFGHCGCGSGGQSSGFGPFLHTMIYIRTGCYGQHGSGSCQYSGEKTMLDQAQLPLSALDTEVYIRTVYLWPTCGSGSRSILGLWPSWFKLCMVSPLALNTMNVDHSSLALVAHVHGQAQVVI